MRWAHLKHQEWFYHTDNIKYDTYSTNTIMALIDNIIARAKSNKQRIVLPESFEERTITAADQALRDELADIILIGNREKILAYAAELGLKNI